MPVEVLERTDVYTVAVWRRVMLLIWRGQTRAVGIDRSNALFREWGERQPGGAAMLVLIPHRPPGPPDDETRAAMARAMGSRSPALRGIATYLEAQGFVAATVFSIISRIHQKHAGEMAPKLFRTVEEAASWAAGLLGDPEITPATLAAAIGGAREPEVPLVRAGYSRFPR
jgi:hypothetical protein